MNVPDIKPSSAAARIRGVGWLGLAAGALILTASAADAPPPETDDATEPAAPKLDPSNPYSAIVARNAFRLKDPLPPPPPPAPPAAPPEQPKLDVKLAGISEIKGVRYAYLMLPDPDRQGQFLYPSLTDDPKRGNNVHRTGLEVREIDLKTQTVRVVNGGVEATLNFQDNGVKNAPVAAAKPGAVPPPPGSVTPGAGVRTAAVPAPGNPSAASAASSEPIVFSRNRNRASGQPQDPVPRDPNSAGLGIPIQPVSVVPSRPLRTGATPNQATPQLQQPQLLPQVSVEQQYEILLRQRQAAESQGIQLPPIPGVPLPTDPNPH